MASEQTRYVRFRYFHWFVPVMDPITEQEIKAERFATHGMKVSTAESGDEPHTAYGLPMERLRWGDANGAFFSDAEVKAMEMGVTDTQLPMESQAEPRGDVGTSIHGTTSLAQATAIVPPAVHPLSFDEMDVMTMSNYMKEADLSANDILAIAEKSPHQAEFLYSAAIIANDGDPPDGLAEGIAEILGYGAADPGTARMGDGEEPPAIDNPEPPTNSGALTPSEPEGQAAEQSDTGDTTGDDSTPEPSDAAVALANENSIDLATVQGSGKDGRIVEADVKKVLADREGQE